MHKKESLEDNTLSIDKIISESDAIFKKANNLKLKLEEEIEKINNSGEKTEEEITLSFKRQHLELEEEEKKLKLNLKFKVKEKKDELNELLIKLQKIISLFQKTNVAIKACENENSKIKTLYYISLIHKNDEKTIDFLK